MKKILGGILFCSLVSPSYTMAIDVTETNSSDTLIDVLLGGESATNADAIGANGSLGTYTNDSSLWDLPDGIILSSGKVTDYADGFNTSSSYSSNMGSSGNTDLSNLSGKSTYDAASLSFEFTATSNQISYDFVFGSEEYKEYVGSNFNDAFGVFLTDSNGEKSQISFDNAGNPITINTAWMQDSSGTELDGDTGKLTTTANVLAGHDYKIEFAIADASDSIYDSTAYISDFQGGTEVNSANAYGLFIGVNDGVGVRGDLDANNFRDALVDANLLDSLNTEVITGANISEDSVFDAIDDMAARMDAGDTFFLHFSGHGGSFLGGGETTLSATDEHIFLGGDRITDDELFGGLSGLDDIEKWLFLDSCNSGGFWGNDNAGDVGDLEKLDNLALFSGSLENTNASAGADGTGIYTNSLLDAFTYDGDFLDADSDNDGFVIFDELDAYLTTGWSGANDLDGTEVFIKGDEAGITTTFSLSDYSPTSIKSDDFDGNVGYYAYLDPNAVTKPSAPVPEPSTILLFGTGIAALAGLRGRKS